MLKTCFGKLNSLYVLFMIADYNYIHIYIYIYINYIYIVCDHGITHTNYVSIYLYIYLYLSIYLSIYQSIYLYTICYISVVIRVFFWDRYLYLLCGNEGSLLWFCFESSQLKMYFPAWPHVLVWHCRYWLIYTYI